MKFESHPILANSYFARIGKYSFVIMLEIEGWFTSWQDQEKGGSASNTIEGPFKNRFQAETNCRNIFKQLRNKQ